MSSAAIETVELSKHYRTRPVVSELTFRVAPGEVYAFVGPNGAGKTTVIRLVTGLAFPTSGTVRLLGEDPLENPQVRHKLGAVVEAPAAFYPYLTGRGNLKLHARLAGGVPDGRISEVLDMMELGNASERKVGVYSLGMRQRLGVAAALLSEPEVLILDEPASGMDPLSIHLVHRVLQEAAQRGAAVLLSTHHLDEVTAYCSRVGILEQGRLIDEVDLRQRRERYRVRVSDAKEAYIALELEPYIDTLVTREDEVIFYLSDPTALGSVSRRLFEADVSLYELRQDTFNLRDYYRERLEHQSTSAQADLVGAPS